jgi:hypothetical protein
MYECCAGVDWEGIRDSKAPDCIQREFKDQDADIWEMKALQDALPTPVS